MTQKIERDDEGYFPIKRKFFRHSFWTEPRVFSKAEAWIDLLRSARFEDSKTRILVADRMVSVGKGEQPASIRFLAKKWSWGEKKVRIFMELLVNEQMIVIRQDAGVSILSLVNYETYNKKGTLKGTNLTHLNPPSDDITPDLGHGEGHGEGHSRGTVGAQSGHKTNKVNKGNKENNNTPGDGTPGISPEEISFKLFQEWILKNAPNVAKMQNQFTFEQWQKLRAKNLSREMVQSLLLQMHNWKPLLKQNTSAYLTIDNWSKRPHHQNELNGHNEQQNAGSKLSEAVRKIKSEIGQS